MFLFRGMATQGKQQPALSGVQFQTSVNGKCIPIIYGTNRSAPNVIWYGDFVATAAPTASAGGKGGVVGGSTGKGGGGSAGYTYKTSLAYGLCEGPIQGVGTLYIDKNTSTLSAQGFSLFTGTYPQTPWSYLTTNHPTEALGYNGLAYIAVANYSLGNSANLPNHNAEIKGIYSNSVGALPDADPSLVFNDLLTNAIYGAGFPSSKVGNLTVYQNYTLASGLLISPAYTTQQQSSQMIDDLCKNTNSAPVWSSGVLNVVPYGDQNISGNGKTYTAPSAPLYDLNDNDFMVQSGADPVMLTRKRQSDQINSLKMEYNDNTNNYNINVVEVKDQASIDTYGLRQDASNNSHLYTNPTAAQTAAQLQLQRQAIRNIYTFTLDQRYILLDPMDIVTLSDSFLKLNRQWVRILTIDEQEDYSLVFTAEEYLDGTGSPAIFGFQSSTGYNANYNEDPGLANVPTIFEVPEQIAGNTGLETWMAVSGGSIWGGCDVYLSSDNATYQYVGTMNGNSRMGSLYATLVSGADPDTVNTLFVDLTESNSQLLSGTQADADTGNTLCYVDGELIAYETATLTFANKYALTYLRRGFYGTTIGKHLAGSNFARLDNQIFAHPYTQDQIGKTIYVKLCGFNIFGGGKQSLSDVVAYPHVIIGPPPPPNVTGFTAKQVEQSVVFSWNNVVDSVLSTYDIRYAPQGTTDWTLFKTITEASKSTEMTTADIPPGTWTFAIRAVDLAGLMSPVMATYDLIVVSLQPVVISQEQSKDWSGTLNGFVRHWSGVLVPEDVNAASFYGWELFDSMVPNPVALSEYITPTFDVGYQDNLRIWSTNHLTEGSGESGSPTATIYLDSWLTGSDPAVYNPWTIGFISLRYMNMKLSYAAVAGSIAFVDEFSFTIDTGPILEDLPVTLSIAPGGTSVTFVSNFRDIPQVTAVVIGNTALYTSVASPTTTGAIIHVWDHSGVDVGAANVTFTARGP